MRRKTIFTRIVQILFMVAIVGMVVACSKNTSSDNALGNDVATKAGAGENTSVDEASTVAQDTTGLLSIKYVGNSCFYIKFADGTRLVTDPYGTSYGSIFGKFPQMEADVMTISHEHEDHILGIKDVTGKPKILRLDKLSTPVTIGDVEITGYDSKHVADLGSNTIFVYKENGLTVVNMGETDNIDSPEALQAIKDADVILAYAGEYGTVKNKDSFITLFNLKIKAIIPEHYSNKAESIFYKEPTIDTILTEIPAGTKVTKTSEFIVKKDLEKQFVALSQMK
ncbi:MBL fold metallo-hydrolase [[Clostridium] fimetarium]|uniref:L-ascorbate metabolism protein UlaG, beta-lactamase superfamily n=1 Tax=[Clostridium] fimetarium TaxID=99656 RepID=A0A1I0P926_9FIRM|nr:MBL fold metallo-hydrolase [[Clostridium] fimetarium]SEW10610.1 L-ascorbate metabolism protein UlaG, beta-lactamase superfamily [[Clostridium] fimetarium]